MKPDKKTLSLSIVIPAKNEGTGLRSLLPKLTNNFPDAEIIVVNDGSTDETPEICKEHQIILINHAYSMGNGAAIKTGARTATSDTIIFMDADGQHNPEDIHRLIAKMNEGYEMVVGARNADGQASFARRIANHLYNKLASVMTGYRIDDLTSGFRIVRARHFRKFLYLLPNGFSYPTTSTMAFFRSGLAVGYISIHAAKREGKSNIRLFKDGLRFFIIIIKIGSLFSPMRLFLPASAALFVLGLSYYFFTFITEHRFTNMSALLLTTSVLVFFIGILSEQISALHYKDSDMERRRTRRDKE
ncbi:MAG: glycosyltransferase family 2 protein [Gammaproteobacteria bacterium]|nr:glycosyltransferase family 2 protein [Gammaproteobacteria bacterium]